MSSTKSPIRKPGVTTISTVTVRMTPSIQLPAAAADASPSTSASTTAMSIAVSVRRAVAGRWVAKACITGCPVCQDVPKSPWTARSSQCQ